MKVFLVLGGVNGFLAVALGAFGAHALRSRISAEALAVWQTGIQYHTLHAIGLLFVGLLSERLSAAGLLWATGWLWTVGIVLFSGSLYALAVTGVKILGAVTPFGGVCFLTGWVLFIAAISRSSNK